MMASSIATQWTKRAKAMLVAVVLIAPIAAVAQTASDRNQSPVFGAVAGNDNALEQPTTDRGSTRIENSELREPIAINSRRDSDGSRRTTGDRVDGDTSREVPPLLRPRVNVPSEFELFIERTLGRKLQRFGNELLLPAARDFAVPPTSTVPPDYVLNAGDTVQIDLTGSVEGSFAVEIDNDGQVFVPRVGTVTLAGVRYGDLKRRLTAAVGKQFRNFTATANLKQLRGIRVYVTGYAAYPGAYSVNSLSTMVNAVLAAGGPASGGSFRKAQLVRGGRVVADLDLYDILLRGDRSRDAVLQNEDVINIAPLGAQVAIVGSVNAEAIYEAREGENIEALVALAGGPGVLADLDRFLLYRTADLEGEIGRELSRATAARTPVVGGDILTVLSAGSLQRPLSQQAVLVRLEGEVVRPGNYFVPPGTPLAQVVERAGGLTANAYVFGTRLERQSVRQQQRAGFLEAVDQLEVSLASAPLNSVGLNPGEEARQLAAAQAVLEKLRTVTPDGRLVLPLQPQSQSLPGDLILENSDRIVVPPRPSAVGVFGAVYRPASFLIGQDGERIRDYVARAGGPIRAADRGQIFVVRANGDVLTRKAGALDARALPGDLVFMPVRTQGNSLLAKLRDISTIAFQFGITAAALAVLIR